MDQFRARIDNWLRQVSTSEQLPSDIVALYVGMFEEKTHYYLYIAGSREFDESSGDWACNQDCEFQNKYLNTQIDTSSVAWHVFLENALAAIKDHVATCPGSILRKVLHVSAGFDDGDLTPIDNTGGIMPQD